MTDLIYPTTAIFSMVFKATITIEWNGWGQPLSSVVFRWFLGPQPSCSMVFDGCPPSVKRCAGHILSLQSYQDTQQPFSIPCDVFENVTKMIWGRDVFFLHLACKMLFWRRNRILERIEYQLPGVGCPLTQMLSRFMATHHRPQNMKVI